MYTQYNTCTPMYQDSDTSYVVEKREIKYNCLRGGRDYRNV